MCTVPSPYRPGRILLAGLCLFLAAPLWSQEPCGFYELDGVPGYGQADFGFSISLWAESGSYPNIPDSDEDSRVSVLDLLNQMNCIGGLSPGLVGSYYGFDNGDPEMEMTFPDFEALTADPVVVKATPQIEDYDGFDGFHNSDMRQRFGAVFEGYLWVPESASYTIDVAGRQGIRVDLDGNEILNFDGSPFSDSATMNLERRLYPIRVEYYSNNRNNSAILSWSSTGSEISASSTVISPDYLLHGGAPVPEAAVSSLEIVFDPPTGSSITTDRPRVKAYVLVPGGNVQLNLNGDDEVLLDGRFDGVIPLATTGLHAIPYRVTDSSGRVLEGEYNLYMDGEIVAGTGLGASLYVDEWYNGSVPQYDGRAISRFAFTGTQLNRDNSNRLWMDSKYVGAHSLIRLEGTIASTAAGEYDFRIRTQGALFINGEKVCAINYDYPGQYQNRGSLELGVGYHHYRMVTSRNSASPYQNVYWQRPGSSSEEEIPPGAFHYSPGHRAEIIDFSTGASGTGGREEGYLVGEYLFDPLDPFADTSGRDFDLMPDPRATLRAGGGVSFRTAAGTASLEAGSNMASHIKGGRAFSLEADFVHDEAVSYNEKRVVGLYSGTRTLARIHVYHNDIVFRLFDENNDYVDGVAQDIVSQGGRYHVVGVYNGSKLKFYVNGVRVTLMDHVAEVSRWPSMATFAVGQHFNRRGDTGTWGQQFEGTILAAAAYLRELEAHDVTTNMNANLSLRPTPDPIEEDPQAPFPRVGTTANELNEAHHVLNRLAFGPSPQMINDVLDLGVDNWIEEQLDPDLIDDSYMESILNSYMFEPTQNTRDLSGWMMFRQAHSERQLLEVMTWFWENHFSTERDKVGSLKEEYDENLRFRSLALGNFRDLLLASAQGYPMTRYLDNDTNIVGAPNENYAREILELHSYGADNGYTQEDIVEAARCFTGWNVRNGTFYFDPGLHDYGSKTLLGITIPAGGGVSDGLTLIDHIAASPHTAAFISFKLCQFFIDDNPPSDVQEAVATRYLETDGDIKEMLRTLFGHARFRTDLNYRGNKTKTPLEFALSVMRATDTWYIGNSVTWHLDNQGMELFNYADPTGYPEEGVAWMDSNAIKGRWDLISETFYNQNNPEMPSLNMKSLIERYDLTTPDRILDFCENITTHGREAGHIRGLAEAWLTGGDPGSFTIDEETINLRIRQTLDLYFRLPEFSKQ